MGIENQRLALTMQEENQDQGNIAFAIGHLLQQARQEKGLSIGEIAAETRIRSIFLQSMEDGRFEKLPGDIYKIGFIKTYASYLGLDGEDILRQLGLHHAAATSYAQKLYKVPKESQRQPDKKVLYLSLVGALGFSVFSYLNYSSSLPKEENHFLPPFPENSEEVSLTNEVPKNDSSDIAKEKPSAQEEDILSHTIVNREEERPSPSLEIKIPESLPSLEEKNLEEEKLPLSKKEIIIKAIKDAWVQILDSSGKIVYVRLMHGGDTYRLPAEGRYTLNTGNAGGVKVVCEGQETNILGSNGQVIRGIPLTTTGLAPYFPSLSMPFKTTKLDKKK